MKYLILMETRDSSPLVEDVKAFVEMQTAHGEYEVLLVRAASDEMVDKLISLYNPKEDIEKP